MILQRLQTDYLDLYQLQRSRKTNFWTRGLTVQDAWEDNIHAVLDFRRFYKGRED
jgi:aryl-alcohol dehydrogenase-like predicted oxidoreductase